MNAGAKFVRPITGAEKELSAAFKNAPPAPEGFNAKADPPPSGFVDQPDVYEQVHVQGQEAEEITVLVDPKQLEVVAVADLPVEEDLEPAGD